MSPPPPSPHPLPTMRLLLPECLDVLHLHSCSLRALVPHTRTVHYCSLHGWALGGR